MKTKIEITDDYGTDNKIVSENISMMVVANALSIYAEMSESLEIEQIKQVADLLGIIAKIDLNIWPSVG